MKRESRARIELIWFGANGSNSHQINIQHRYTTKHLIGHTINGVGGDGKGFKGVLVLNWAANDGLFDHK